MEGATKTERAFARALAFYQAQGCSWAGKEEIYSSIKKHELPGITKISPESIRVDGFYFSEKTIEKEIILEKLSVAKKFLKFFMLVPFSRMFLLGGSLACGTPKEGSDIDLIVLAKHNRVWLNRIFLISLSAVLGKRRSKKKFKNRFCFNYSLSERFPVIQNQDFVSAHFYKHILPLCSASKTNVKQFWRANSWLKSYSPLFNFQNQDVISYPHKKKVERTREVLETILEYSGMASLMEISFRKIYRIFIKRRLKKFPQNSQMVAILEDNCIHYHFPISNWEKSKKQYLKLVSSAKVVEKV